MARSRHAAGGWSNVIPGEGFLRDQARIKERRQVRLACRTRDWSWLDRPVRPAWAAWS